MCCCDSKAYKGPQYVMSFENMTNNSTISRKKNYVQPCLKNEDSTSETKNQKTPTNSMQVFNREKSFF